ncbi:MAG: sodium:alanine symporter family protein [Pyramidobacter sp.]|nr:sodium:alanine symporter family protein [Pyramidobacter sp.]
MESISETLNGFFNLANGFLFGPVMLAVFVGTGVYMTLRTNFVQFARLKTAFAECFGGVFRKESGAGNIRPYQALSGALSSCIGIGNIGGVSSAIAIGGPGAVFWMWVSALFGMATKFAEIALAMEYREQDAQGNYRGGVMYILSRGMKNKPLGKLLGGAFAAFCAMVALVSCNAVQSNSIAESLRVTFPGVQPAVWGAVLVLVVGLVIFGGIKKIAAATTFLTPLMAGIYLILGTVIIVFNFRQVPEAFRLIFVSAFRGDAAVGGIAGATMLHAMRMGVARGIFSNEAGCGSSPLIHVTAKVDVPTRQALYGVVEVFVDTIVVCTFTALIVLTSGIWNSGETGVALSNLAWKGALGGFGDAVLTVSLILFGISTILGWAWYGETAAEFLFGVKAIVPYRLLHLSFTFLGSVTAVSVVWNAADFCNGLMVLPNLLSLWLFAPQISAVTKAFFARSEFSAKSGRA